MSSEIIALSNKTSVRFNRGTPFNRKIFSQPIYYISQNIVQIINKNNKSSDFKSELIDENLGIDLDNSLIKLELNYCDDWKEVDINYSLENNDYTLKFQYKGKEFTYKTISLEYISSPLITEGSRDNYRLYTSYEINFDKDDLPIFNDFIKVSIQYYEKYFINKQNNKDKINIYLTSQEGFYFHYLGNKHKRDMASIYLPKKQKDLIVKDIEKFLLPTTKSKYQKLGINYKRTYLLEGIPGTGKTSLITGLASYFNYNIAIVSFIPKMTDVDLVRCLRSINDCTVDRSDTSTEENNKIFIVFEDIDCIFKERKSHDEQRNNVSFSGLLNALDGICTNDEIICFITTNYKNNLDSALLRPGRIDYIMRFDYSTKEQILDIYNSFTDCKDDTKALEFYNECVKLNIKITTSLLQQYLMKYIDMPDDAIVNIGEMKEMYDKCNVSKEAEDTGLYG